MADKEYIERGALLKMPPFTAHGGNLSEYNEGYLDCADKARNAVNDAPAADVVPVVHGEWVKAGFGITERIVCSVCNSSKGYFGRPPFCNQCDAKMDGGKEQV